MGACFTGERSRLLPSTVPDCILQPRLVLTLRTKDGGTQQVTMSVHSAGGQEDPEVLDLVRDRKTESLTLSTNSRAIILQLIASCRFVLDSRRCEINIFYLLTGKRSQRSLSNVTMSKSVRQGKFALGDQPRKWWRTFGKFFIEAVGFRPASDGSVCVVRVARR